ncbi:5'-AMP-activated protein kinase subunit gamma-1 [Symbiodinium microadriaticum]|uniref:5'-AMP-activated protein kinase subunit gamma-1 n=1 Tax=Symbiodinium microadriaticum TaxID=2951 RepID=A0A1Q9EXY8_SYMMI|nr:5'-AMP-activated protein kinase subunit gamma-1 [Symbiodinium microadriaticum]
MDLTEFLKKYKVKDLPLPKSLVTLKQSSDGLYSAIQALTEHHLLSAPVVDSSGKLAGMLDTLDIAAHVVEMEAAGKKKLPNEKLEKVMGRGSPNAEKSLCTVELDQDLKQVVDNISGNHRRALVLEDGKPLSIITHSTIIAFMNSKLSELEALLGTKLAQDVCTPGVTTINDSATALMAFQTLVTKGVSSLAITDEDGVAITVVSATDLVMALGHEDDKSAVISDLKTRNVVFFVGDSRKPDRAFSHTRAPIISVSVETPLTQVIEKFATTRVHRMLVMEKDSRRPIGVVALSDICRAFSAAAQEPSTLE